MPEKDNVTKSRGFHATTPTETNVTGVNGGGLSTHGDVEDGDYIEGRGEDGAHAFD